jgi:ribonuclease P protein component
MALSQKNRLASDKDIRALLRKGKTVQGSFFFLKARKSEDSVLRAAVIVPGKISENAVVRNRMKRVLTELLRTYLKKTRDMDVVCMVTHQFSASDEATREEFRAALMKLSL